jgi:hypothetical protein
MIGPAGPTWWRVPLELLDRLPILSVHSGLTPTDWSIVWQIRAPRVVLAAIVGSTLSIAGASYQGVFRNPLVDPYLLGVAAGAKAPEYRTIANMGRAGLRVYERGLAKIFGEAGRAEPGFRKMGQTAKAASQERYLETTFPTGMRNGYTYDRYAGTPTQRLPDGSIKLKNTKIDEYGNAFPGPGFKRMIRRGR